MVALTPSEIAGPPAFPAEEYPELLPEPPVPPLPIIYPLLISVTPLGQEPLIVKPAVPVLSDQTYTPAPTVALTGIVPSHPAANANVLKLASC
jgi:hypothetical protein